MRYLGARILRFVRVVYKESSRPEMKKQESTPKGMKRFVKGKMQGMSLYKATAKEEECNRIHTNKNNYGQNQQPKHIHSVPIPQVTFAVHQDQLLPQPRVSVHLLHLPAHHINATVARDEPELFNNGMLDDNVDLKAAHYISTVKERFKLPRLNS